MSTGKARKYVLMIVPSNFPNGDAGAVRDMSFAMIYRELGYDVILLGMGKGQKRGIYKGVNFYSFYINKKNTFDHLIQFISYRNRISKKIIKLEDDIGSPSLIHINDISPMAINWIIYYAKKHNIEIVHDSTEWYSKCEFKKGALDKSYILKNLLNTRIIRKPIKVIAISSYLKKHFENNGIEAIRIPVIMDINASKPSLVQTDKKIRLIYAGSPASKDHLKEIIDAIESLKLKEQERLLVHIVGIDADTLKQISGKFEFPKCVKTYGRVSRDEVEKIMENMDFSMLLRPSSERYTKAGFPTKVVEAMAHRVAMICNITSDLGMYLEDNVNSVVVEECTSEDFAIALKRILKMNRNDIEKIKNNARKTALEYFDYHKYVYDVNHFLNL